MKDKNSDWEPFLKSIIMHAVNTSSSVDGKALNPKVKVYIENNIISKMREFLPENVAETTDDLLDTVHWNACNETIKNCAQHWGLMEGGKWKEEYLHLTYPVHPQLNKIKKI